MSRVLSFVLAAGLAGAAMAQQTSAPAPAAPAPARPAAAAPAPAALSNAPLATVNGTPIRKATVDQYVKQLGRGDSEEIRKAILSQLIDTELLVQEARKRKLDTRADVKFDIEMAQRKALAIDLIRDEVEAHKISDEQVKADYDRQVQAMGGKEYRARHILVDTEEEAKAIIAKLDKGEKFEDLAKGTKDTVSAAKGGDLDWSAPGNFVKPFSDAMVALEKGKYTPTPVKTQYGFHVIRLDDVRATTPPPFEQVKGQLGDRLRNEQVGAFIKSLHDKADIK